MPDLTLRRATAADERLLAALAARLSAFELPSWRAPLDISDADARAMIAAVAGGDPDDEVLIAERAGEVVGCLHVLAVTDFFGLRHGHVSVIATTEAAEGSGVARRADGARRAVDRRARAAAADAQHVRRECAGPAVLRDRTGFEVEMVKYAKANLNPKLQIPSSKEFPTPNSQTSAQAQGSWLRIWQLQDPLGFGAWSLGFDTTHR